MKKKMIVGMVVLVPVLTIALIVVIFSMTLNNVKIVSVEQEKTQQSSNNNNGNLEGISIDGSVDGFNQVLESFMVTATTWYYPASFGGGWHPGIDLGSLGSTIGDNIFAPTNSIVLHTESSSSGYGNFVVLLNRSDDQVFTSIYAHLDSYLVNQGQVLQQGEVFAHLGNTGFSTGPHLHMEIFLHNASYEDVLAQYQATNDYWFGLSYNSVGNCSSVCRLAPSEVLGLEMGAIYNFNIEKEIN